MTKTPKEWRPLSTTYSVFTKGETVDADDDDDNYDLHTMIAIIPNMMIAERRIDISKARGVFRPVCFLS